MSTPAGAWGLVKTLAHISCTKKPVDCTLLSWCIEFWSFSHLSFWIHCRLSVRCSPEIYLHNRLLRGAYAQTRPNIKNTKLNRALWEYLSNYMPLRGMSRANQHAEHTILCHKGTHHGRKRAEISPALGTWKNKGR